MFVDVFVCFVLLFLCLCFMFVLFVGFFSGGGLLFLIYVELFEFVLGCFVFVFLLLLLLLL